MTHTMNRFGKPSRRLQLVAAIAALLALATAAPTMASTSKSKPTIVLVHGAFADSSSWNGVVSRLQRKEYRVRAFANPLRGLSADAGQLAATLASIQGPIVLVGHSYGGSVITQAANGNPNVKALVYVAGFAPGVGETVLDLAGKFPGSELASALQAVPVPLPDGSTGADLSIDPARYRALFTGTEVPAARAAVLAATQRPITAAANNEPATAAAWKTISSWALVTEDDRLLPPAAQRFMARRANAHTTRVRAAHAVMLSHPDAVAKIILQAAGA